MANINKNKEGGFRAEKREEYLARLRADLSEEELKRIEEQRKFDVIEPDSITWKIALRLDSLRKQRDMKKLNISKALWNIEDMQNNIDRCNLELSSGTIITKLADKDAVMNAAELSTYIKHIQWLQEGEVRGVLLLLSELRAVVGHRDLIGNNIMSIEEFDKYVMDIQETLKRFGYDLFD